MEVIQVGFLEVIQVGFWKASRLVFWKSSRLVFWNHQNHGDDCYNQMVRSKSSGHLSESQSSLLGASPGERLHPGERLLGASVGERSFLGERYHPAGEIRPTNTSSLPMSLPPTRSTSHILIWVIPIITFLLLSRSVLSPSTSPHPAWDQRCRIIFPTTFLLFNILYWTLLLRTS